MNIFSFQKRVQNLILYGSPGTGKTLMLVEILRLKVGQFKMEKKPYKVIIATYVSYATKLREDLKENFNIGYLFEELGIETVTMEDLSKSKSIFEEIKF